MSAFTQFANTITEEIDDFFRSVNRSILCDFAVPNIMLLRAADRWERYFADDPRFRHISSWERMDAQREQKNEVHTLMDINWDVQYDKILGELLYFRENAGQAIDVPNTHGFMGYSIDEIRDAHENVRKVAEHPELHYFFMHGFWDVEVATNALINDIDLELLDRL